MEGLTKVLGKGGPLGLLIAGFVAKFEEGEQMKLMGGTMATQLTAGFGTAFKEESVIGEMGKTFFRTTKQLREDVVGLVKAGGVDIKASLSGTMTTFYNLTGALQINKTEAQKLMSDYHVMGKTGGELTKNMLAMKAAASDTAMSFDQFRTSVEGAWQGLRVYGIEVEDVSKLQRSVGILGFGEKNAKALGIQSAADITKLTTNLISGITGMSMGAMAYFGKGMSGKGTMEDIWAMQTGGMKFERGQKGFDVVTGETSDKASMTNRILAVSGKLAEFLKTAPKGAAGAIVGRQMLAGAGLNTDIQTYNLLTKIANDPTALDDKTLDKITAGTMSDSEKLTKQTQEMTSIGEKIGSLEEKIPLLIGDMMDLLATGFMSLIKVVGNRGIDAKEKNDQAGAIFAGTALTLTSHLVDIIGTVANIARSEKGDMQAFGVMKLFNNTKSSAELREENRQKEVTVKLHLIDAFTRENLSAEQQ